MEATGANLIITDDTEGALVPIRAVTLTRAAVLNDLPFYTDKATTCVITDNIGHRFVATTTIVAIVGGARSCNHTLS